MASEKMAIELNDGNFKDLALNNDQIVVVDFWAEWCGPCKMIGPVVEQLAEKYKGKAVVGKVDVDNNPEISSKYGIRSIPTILFLKKGRIVEKHVGATSIGVLAGKLEAAMAAKDN